MKLRILLITLIAAVAFAGCEKDEKGKPGNSKAYLDQDNVELDYLAGSSTTIEIKTEVEFMRIFTSSDGVNVSTETIIEVLNGEIKKNNYSSINNILYVLTEKEGGYTLEITAQEDNYNENPIVEHYVLKTADDGHHIKVTQATKGELVDMDRDFFPEGGSYEVTLTAESGKQLEIEKVIGGDWLIYNYSGSTLKLTAPYWTDADGTADRETVLRVSNTSQGTVELRVKQEAPYIRLSKATILIKDVSVVEEVTVMSNLEQGAVALSDKLEAIDEENRISSTSLSYADSETRDAVFTVSVDLDGMPAGEALAAKYNVSASGPASGLVSLEKTLAISRSQVLMEEIFDYSASSLYDVWDITKSTGRDLASFMLNQTPLTYSDAVGEYILSGVGKAMQRDYFTDGQNVEVQQVSGLFEEHREGILYTSFIFKLENIPYRDGKPTNYHATQYALLGYSDAGTSRTTMCWVGKEANKDSYRFGLTLASTDGSKVVWSTKEFTGDGDFATHLLVLKYDVATKRSELFIDPVLGAAETAPDVFIDVTSNNPFNDANSTNRVRALYLYDNVKNANINCQLGGIRVGRAWDEAVEAKEE